MNAQMWGTGDGPCGGCGGGFAGPSGGCCANMAAATPQSVANRPGLGSLAYRVGTQPAFLSAMQARLSSADHPELAGLRTRELSDPAMALLDAWATVADVLTFYQERIANEGYLRTATEQRSVWEQAQLVGYRLRPGVAASVYLAYTVDINSGAVTIPAGSRSNSVPGPGEKMQSFETSDDLDARPEWNLLRPRMSRPQTPGSVLGGSISLAGTATNLKVRDPLLVDLGSGDLTPARVQSVTPDAANDRTVVTLRDWDGNALGASVLTNAVNAVVQGFAAASDSATAQRVHDLLAGLTEKVKTGRMSAVAQYLRADVLPALRKELADARSRGYLRLVPLLEATLEQAERAAALMVGPAQPGFGISGSALSGSGFAPPTAPPTAPPAVAFARDDGGVPLLLRTLRRPPSVPPAGPRQLERTYAGTFAGGMDVYPHLLTSLFTQLAPVLYAALAQSVVSQQSGLHVYALREQASLFGHNAPKAPKFDGSTPLPATQWTEWPLAGDEVPPQARLDAAYDQVLPGSLVIIQRGPPAGQAGFTVLVGTVKDAVTVSRSEYGMSGKSTILTVDSPWWNPPGPVVIGLDNVPVDDMATLRSSTIFCRQEELALAPAPVTDDVAGVRLELDGLYDGLAPGRWATVSGERTDIAGTTGVAAAELVMIAGVEQSVESQPSGLGGARPAAGEQLHTYLTFAQPLAYTYARGTVRVHGNVAHATHGETRTEVLGGGNAAQSLQTFTLKQPPLTYVAAPTPEGASSTLVVRVNDVQWHQSPGLAYMGPDDRMFLTGTDDGGHTAVTFGTGRRGQRLPTGVDNVRTVYRNGIGSPGNVRPGQISQLATRPLGVTEVTNPISATGGADAEPRDAARSNVPLAVASLDRLVSVRDYADFARTFAGVGKASAALLTDGRRRLVQVTIAGAGDIPIDATSDLYRNLFAALHQYGDPHQPVQLAVRELLALVLSANVRILPDHDWDVVEPALREALLAEFGFDNLGLGEDLATSRVIASMAGVRGVDYVDLDLLEVYDETALAAGLADLTGGPPTAAAVGRRIAVAPDRFEDGVLKAAQLACLRPDVPETLMLNEVKP